MFICYVYLVNKICFVCCFCLDFNFLAVDGSFRTILLYRESRLSIVFIFAKTFQKIWKNENQVKILINGCLLKKKKKKILVHPTQNLKPNIFIDETRHQWWVPFPNILMVSGGNRQIMSWCEWLGLCWLLNVCQKSHSG